MATKLMIYTVEDADGTQYEIEGPEGATPEDLQSVLAGIQTTTPSAPSPEPAKEGIGDIFGRRLEEAQGERPGLDPINEFGGNNPFIGDTGIPNPLYTLQSAADVVARGGEYLGAGLNTGLELLDQASVALSPGNIAQKIFGGENYGEGNEIRFGSMAGALGEGFPLGGIEAGFIPASAPARWSNSQFKAFRKEVDDMIAEGGNRVDIDAITRKYKVEPFGEDLDRALAARDAGGEIPRVGEYAPSRSLEQEAQAFQEGRRETPATPLEQEARAFRGRRDPTPEDLFPTEESRLVREAELESSLQAEADAFRNRNVVPDEVPTSPVETEAMATVRIKTDEISAKWTNAPEIEIVDSFDGLEGFDPQAIGATTPEGRVVLNARAVAEEAAALGVSPDDVTSAALFHEGLGHYGLSQRFGNELDGFLENLYERSTKFRKDVDEWQKRNPDYYSEDLNPLARAAEEVLAEMSENGQISPTLYGRIRNKFKEFAREIGIDLEFSEGEIRTILGMAHDTVVRGEGVSATAPSLRFMRRRTVGKGSEGPLQGTATREGNEPNTPISKFRSNRNLEEISQEIMSERTSETWDQWIDEAGNIKMTTKAAENLAKGIEPAQLKAAERFLLESQNRIFDLSKKVGDGYGTARDRHILGQEIVRAQRVAQSIQDVVSNSARILNSRKIEVASDRALSDSIRRMLRSIDNKMLESPEGVEAAARLLREGNKEAQAMAKSLDVLANALSMPRSLMSSMDLSAPLRQGVFLVGRKELWKGIPSMFKQFGSEEAFNAAMADIRRRPRYQMMEDSGLSIADLGGRLVDREEQFISQWAEKIPVIGKGVRASERAYVGFLNKVRADVFDSIAQKYEDAGVTLTPFGKQARDISKFVNNATGRGDLGKFNQAAPILSAAFFSPRLMVSRVSMLNPRFYQKLDPIVRKEALKSLASFGGIATSVAMLAKIAGADVEADPRSSDFAKIKVNNTRYDILGGFGQYLTLGARMATNERKNAKGEVQELGKRYGADTRRDVLLQFGINKFSPIASFVSDYLHGKNAIGEPFEVRKATMERFIPLFFQDAADLIKEEGAQGIPMSLPGLFGVGTNTYDIPLGYDALGRDIKTLLKEDKPEDNPVAIEIERLNKVSESPVLARAPASIKEDGVSYKLTDEQRDEFQRIMGDLQNQFLSEDIATEDWALASDEEQIEIVKAAHRDAYQQTKEHFLDNVLPEPLMGTLE